MTSRTVAALAFAACACTLIGGRGQHVAAQSPPDVLGAWSAREYHLSDGPTHTVRGQIIFTEGAWQVLFFVMDETGAARRGSGEGGSYHLTADGVVFRHLFNLSVGQAMEGLEEAPLRMVTRDPGEAPLEPTRVEVVGDVLTLYFPSGNRMTFVRTGGGST